MITIRCDRCGVEAELYHQLIPVRGADIQPHGSESSYYWLICRDQANDLSEKFGSDPCETARLVPALDALLCRACKAAYWETTFVQLGEIQQEANAVQREKMQAFLQQGRLMTEAITR